MKKIEYERKQVVVQKKSVKWKCEICGKEYRDKGDAYTCEKIHKNKEALSKIEPKFKVGGVVTYVDKWDYSTKYGRIFRLKPLDDYSRWGYCMLSNGYETTAEEESLTYVCSKEEVNSIIEDIVGKIKKQIRVSKKNIGVELLPNGEFKVTFTMKDDKIPVIVTYINKED